MKKLNLLLYLFFSALVCFSQSPVDSVSVIRDDLNRISNESNAFSKKKKYDKSIKKCKELVKYYRNINPKYKYAGRSYMKSALYNMACYYTLLGETDSAMYYLSMSVDYGYNNYKHILVDSDLDRLRENPEFKNQLQRIRETGDFKYILSKHSNYSSTKYQFPSFTYQDRNAPELIHLRQKYNLDSVAGEGDELCRIINLMSWVHNMVPHDGSSGNPAEKTADAIITLCQSEDRGVNCRMVSTVLNEVYLSLGFKSRYITCMPAPLNFDDCHVINMVYSETLDKWLWMDASFEAYILDKNGRPMSIQEIREGLISGRDMKVSESLNWNGKPYSGGAERYLHEYMAKNLFRFSCIVSSGSGLESSERPGVPVYLVLVPSNYEKGKVKPGEIFPNRWNIEIFMDNQEQFWESL